MALFRRKTSKEDTLASVRAASVGLYGGSGVSIVPNLTFGGLRGQRPEWTPEIANNALLFGPAWKIAFRLGAIPIKVFSLGTEQEREEEPDHPAYQLLRSPNPILTRNLLISGTVFSLLQEGTCGWYKNRETPGAPPVELWPIPGDVLFPVKDPNALIKGYEIRLAGQQPKPLPLDDVVYFRLVVDPDDWIDGMSPMQVLGPISRYGQSAMDAVQDYFDHALLGRIWINMGNKELSPAARNRLQAQMEIARRDKYGVPVMEDGATINNMGPHPEASVLADAIKNSEEIINEALGLPPPGKTEVQRFYGEVVAPIADAIEQELERSLMTEWPDNKAFPEFQFREILVGDPQQRAQLHQTRILSGQETPNEARRAENLPPIEGGDSLFVPLNLIPIDLADEIKRRNFPKDTLTDPTTDPLQNTQPQDNPNAPTPPMMPPPNPPGNGSPRRKDSAGGLGGNQGKGTLPKVAAARAADSAGIEHWRLVRTRTITAYSMAAARRLKGVLRNEEKDLKQLITGDAASRSGLPSPEEIAMVVHVRGRELESLLRGFMQQAADAGWTNANQVMPTPYDQLPTQVRGAFVARALNINDAFTTKRQHALRDLLGAVHATEGLDASDLTSEISSLYSGYEDAMASGLARTEVSWAHEQAALAAWHYGGATQIDLVQEGTSCSTGVCTRVSEGSPYSLGEPLENVGFTFAGTDAPPLHPHCECLTWPVS